MYDFSHKINHKMTWAVINMRILECVIQTHGLEAKGSLIILENLVFVRKSMDIHSDVRHFFKSQDLNYTIPPLYSL